MYISSEKNHRSNPGSDYMYWGGSHTKNIEEKKSQNFQRVYVMKKKYRYV